MKKFFYLISMIFILLFLGCEGKKFGIPTESIIKILPVQTQFLLKIDSLENQYQNFITSEKEFFDNSLAEIEEVIGFNPLKIENLINIGINTKKEIGFLVCDLILGDQVGFNTVSFIPVTDYNKLLNKIQEIIKKKNPAITFKAEGVIQFVEISPKDKVFFINKNNYLYLVTQVNSNAKPIMDAILTGKPSLDSNPEMINVATKQDINKDIFIFADIKSIFDKNSEFIKNILGGDNSKQTMKLIKDYESLGFTMDVKTKDLFFNFIFNIKPGSELLNYTKGVSFNKKLINGVENNPALIISFLINPKQYYNELKSLLTAEDYQELIKGTEEIKKNKDLDIEKDIIENLDGNFHLASYDGATINMMNYNTVFIIGIKDEAKMKTLLDKIIDKVLPAEQKSLFTKNKDGYVINIFGMVQIYIGIKNNGLIIASGKNIFDKVANGKISSGFISKIKDEKLATILKGDYDVFYISIEELALIIKNFTGLLQSFSPNKIIDKETDVFMNQFEYFLIDGIMDGNAVMAEMILKTKFKKPFMQEFSKIMHDAKKKNSDSN